MADMKSCAGATDFTLAALAGSGGVIDSSGTTTLYLDPCGGTLDCFSAIADGAGLVSLALTDSGTLVLYGTNSYTGGTTVTADTLEVGSSGLLPIGTLTIGASADSIFGNASLSAASASAVIPAAAPVTVVPEPGTLLLFFAALCSAAIYRRFSPRSQTAIWSAGIHYRFSPRPQAAFAIAPAPPIRGPTGETKAAPRQTQSGDKSPHSKIGEVAS
jgi:autotransporter-associated beta strand protein